VFGSCATNPVVTATHQKILRTNTTRTSESYISFESRFRILERTRATGPSIHQKLQNSSLVYACKNNASEAVRITPRLGVQMEFGAKKLSNRMPPWRCGPGWESD